MASILDTQLPELEKRVGFDPARPCIFCEQPVERLSCGGPLICPACDCGQHRDGRKWSIPEATVFYRNARRRMGELQKPDKG